MFVRHLVATVTWYRSMWISDGTFLDGNTQLVRGMIRLQSSVLIVTYDW